MAFASMTISWQMLPVEAPQPDEDLGFGGGPPVRLIDNIVLKPLRL
jgi:pantoate--beta-alanine ligase